MLRYVRANLVGFLALFVALGGTGYAALKLPKHSVGQRALKTGAVNSRVVRNHSIAARDLARGLSLAGPAGPQGAQGPKGDQGGLGPTEGGGSDIAPFTGLSSEESTDQTQFTTTHPGKVLLSKTLASLSVTCSTGAWTIWLQVDGVRVPGTLDGFNASPSTLHAITLTGVTSAPLATGTHTASFGLDCTSGNATSTSSASNSDLTYAVLGSG